MKDIQHNLPCSTGTYPLKKHNHKDASSEAALTHTWTMILSHWSSVQSWKSSSKWFLIQHGHMNLSLVQLEPCSIVAHYYTHYTMMNSATGARLPFLRLLAWFRSWRPNWKKCHCIFLLQINPHLSRENLKELSLSSNATAYVQLGVLRLSIRHVKSFISKWWRNCREPLNHNDK